MIVSSYLVSTYGRHGTVSNIYNTYVILQHISYTLMTLMTGAYTATMGVNILHLLKVSV
jgi:hypothetical protein